MTDPVENGAVATDRQALEDALKRLESSVTFRGHEDQLYLLHSLLKDGRADLARLAAMSNSRSSGPR